MVSKQILPILLILLVLLNLINVSFSYNLTDLNQRFKKVINKSIIFPDNKVTALSDYIPIFREFSIEISANDTNSSVPPIDLAFPGSILVGSRLFNMA